MLQFFFCVCYLVVVVCISEWKNISAKHFLLALFKKPFFFPLIHFFKCLRRNRMQIFRPNPDFLTVHVLPEGVWFLMIVFQSGACLAVCSLVPNTKYRTSLLTSVKESSFSISLNSAKNNKHLAPDCSTGFFFSLTVQTPVGIGRSDSVEPGDVFFVKGIVLSPA